MSGPSKEAGSPTKAEENPETTAPARRPDTELSEEALGQVAGGLTPDLTTWSYATKKKPPIK